MTRERFELISQLNEWGFKVGFILGFKGMRVWRDYHEDTWICVTDGLNWFWNDKLLARLP